MFTPLPRNFKKVLDRNLKKIVIDNEYRTKVEKSIREFLDSMNNTVLNNQTEGNIKIPITRFLETFFYNNHINSNSYKGLIESDLVIKENKKSDSNTNVIIELKRTENKELITREDINRKSFHELVLYYLYERIVNGNQFVTKGIITDGYEWFLFDSNELYNKFYDNKKVNKFFCDWISKKTDSPKTNIIYEFLSSFLNDIDDTIKFDYFDLRTIKNENIDDFIRYFSPVNILKENYTNDSNVLNGDFYFELLYILGLEEQKKDGRKIIHRCTDKQLGSIIENTIHKIESEDLVSNINLKDLYQFGDNSNDRLFNLSLELVVTWINRILFLKLLESQLIKFNPTRNKKFLNNDLIPEYDVLNNLFFDVLSERPQSRRESYNKFNFIPYLNSSLFETTDLERKIMRISNLDNSERIKVYKKTILKDSNGKRLSNTSLRPLEYLLRFLDSFNFGSNKDDLQKKILINSSVLGLIFEKINGYKDGSVYTPSLITTYLSDYTIRNKVIDLFNEKFQIDCKNLDELYNVIHKVSTIQKSNEIIDNIKICDPSVGSGHFLVSCLNSIIKLKSDLGILLDENQRVLSNVHINCVNDELVTLDEYGEEIQYFLNDDGKPKITLQNIQKTIFGEKKKIIENCLFGVDINRNSVKICRLRLWIELLKSSYYTDNSNFSELETLPNIDINIKDGNSLLSRYSINEDLNEIFKKDKNSIVNYKRLVYEYKNTNDKSLKKNHLEPSILKIRENIEETIEKSTKLELSKVKGQISNINIKFKNLETFGEKVDPKEIVKLKSKEKDLQKIELKIREVKENIKYKSSFEWRYEFSEILNEEGIFQGFDILIGNPPYIKENDDKKIFDGLRDLPCYQGKMDIWYLFGCLGLELLKPDGYLSFISTNNWTTNQGGRNFRNRICTHSKIIQLIDFGSVMVFDDVSIQTMIMVFKKNSTDDNYPIDFRRISKSTKESNQIIDILNKVPSEGIEIFSPNFVREHNIDKLLSFNDTENNTTLNRIVDISNFRILDNEIVQGIVPNPDYVNSRNVKNFSKSDLKERNINIGDGVFVVENNLFQNLDESEMKYLKPLYEPTDIDRFYLGESKGKIIYITKNNFNQDCPTLLDHLSRYKEIMFKRRENQNGRLDYYHLHWSRDESYFKTGSKILSVRKCKYPTFVYTEKETYVMMSMNVIRTERINNKYLTGILNSNVIEYFFKRRGKLQGENYQIDSEPILETPIVLTNQILQDEIVRIVDDIIDRKNNNVDTEELESKLNKIVYQIYSLNENDIYLIETTLKGNLSLKDTLETIV